MLTVPRAAEVTRPLLCEGRKNGRVIFPKNLIGMEYSGETFQLLEIEGGNLVAIIATNKPLELWAIYNLREPRSSWPSPDFSISWEEEYQILDELLMRWKANIGKLYEPVM